MTKPNDLMANGASPLLCSLLKKSRPGPNPIEENSRSNLLYADISAFLLAENGHITFFSQLEHLNFSIE